MNEFVCSLAVTLALTLGGQPPVPGHPMETVMQDDAQLLHRSPAILRRDVRRMADIGVDRVRLTASWSTLAPGSRVPAPAALRRRRLPRLPRARASSASTTPCARSARRGWTR